MTVADYLSKHGPDLAGLLEIWSNAACAGYTAAACIGAGLTAEQTEAVLANLEAAFDNMTTEEAEQLYSSDEWRPA